MIDEATTTTIPWEMLMNNLKKSRMEAGMTAYALATKAGTLEGRIFAFERDRYNPRPDEAKRIARALHAQPKALFPMLFGRAAERDHE